MQHTCSTALLCRGPRGPLGRGRANPCQIAVPCSRLQRLGGRAPSAKFMRVRTMIVVAVALCMDISAFASPDAMPPPAMTHLPPYQVAAPRSWTRISGSVEIAPVGFVFSDDGKT